MVRRRLCRRRHRPNAPAIIFFTSGSTGKPKGVTHSHDTFGWMVASAIAGLGITPDDVFLPATSASHVACSSLSFAGLAAGACVAMARSSVPTNCCHCFAVRGRRCCARCPFRCLTWCATTAQRGKIFNRSGDASRAATKSQRSWSTNTRLNRARHRGAVWHDGDRHVDV